MACSQPSGAAHSARQQPASTLARVHAGPGLADGGQQAAQVVEPLVDAAGGQPAEHPEPGLGAVAADVDRATPRVEHLVGRVDLLRHRERALQPHRAEQFGEQQHALLRGQAEIEQRAGRLPRRVGAQPDPQQAEAFQGLALVEGHQLAHHPAGRLPAAALSRLPAGEHPGTAGRGRGLLDQVVHRGLRVAGGGPRQAVHDQPSLPHESVAGLEIGGEERGRLPAVTEREQLPAAAGPVRQLLIGGQRLVQRGGQHRCGRLVAALQQPHHPVPRAPQARHPFGVPDTAAAAAPAAGRRGTSARRRPRGRGHRMPRGRGHHVQRPAAPAQHGVLGGSGRGSLEDLVILVCHLGWGVEQQPGAAVGPHRARREALAAGSALHRASQVNRSAPLAAAELEHGA